MYSGTLINDLFAAVERAHPERTHLELAHAKPACADSRSLGVEPHADACHCASQSSQPEQFPQPPGLSPADWNLCLFLVVHAQLVRALEPRNDFADAVDVYQVGAVGSP